jgi:mannitol/fructose-specific phosphotransferase system IIA component (Ntr-type)
MRISDVLTEELVKLELGSKTRDDAIRELVGILAQRGCLERSDVGALVEAILQRERLGSTAIGHGVAIPHAKAPCACQFMAAFGRSSEGIDFGAKDAEPVHLVFLLASAPDSQRTHLRALAGISRLLSRQDLRARILAAESEKEILEILKAGEEG